MLRVGASPHHFPGGHLPGLPRLLNHRDKAAGLPLATREPVPDPSRLQTPGKVGGVFEVGRGRLPDAPQEGNASKQPFGVRRFTAPFIPVFL